MVVARPTQSTRLPPLLRCIALLCPDCQLKTTTRSLIICSRLGKNRARRHRISSTSLIAYYNSLGLDRVTFYNSTFLCLPLDDDDDASFDAYIYLFYYYFGMIPYLYWLEALFGLVVALFNADFARGAVNWTVTPFNPPAIPLAVRTPYLSAWLMQGEGAALNEAWSAFWTGSVSLRARRKITRIWSKILMGLQILGWAGYVRVDGETYLFLGDPTIPGATKAVQQSFEVRAFPWFRLKS